MLTMGTVFQFMIKLCKTMRDSKHRAITQTMDTHESHLVHEFVRFVLVARRNMDEDNSCLVSAYLWPSMIL